MTALIFDLDGTLADTMPLHWHAWQMVTQRHSLHFPEDRFYSLGGVPSRDILKMLAAEQGRSLPTPENPPSLPWAERTSAHVLSVCR